MRKEALAYKSVRKALRSLQTTEDAAKTIFEKVLYAATSQLLPRIEIIPMKGIPYRHSESLVYDGHVAIKGRTNASRLWCY